MIELLSASRCTRCNLCVKACPTNVFDPREDDVPVIARPEHCQTCFMCELYCPVDALYVSPLAFAREHVPEATVDRDQRLGSYARRLGWRGGRPGGTEQDPTFYVRREIK